MLILQNYDTLITFISNFT